MERWTGRVAIVTGASSGIGADIAKTLAEQGMKVVAVARRIELVQKLAQELHGAKGEVIAIQGDVCEETDVKRVIKWTKDHLGGVDVLVNNAGVCPLTSLCDLDTTAMKQIFNTNVFGLCMFTSAAIQDMKSRGVDDGHILHINSITGHQIYDVPGLGPYSSSKHVVTVLTEVLRRELCKMKSKIRVTSISPGLVGTDLFRASGFSKEAMDRVFPPQTPLLNGRDIANAVIYALSAPPDVQVHDVTVHPTGEVLGLA